MPLLAVPGTIFPFLLLQSFHLSKRYNKKHVGIGFLHMKAKHPSFLSPAFVTTFQIHTKVQEEMNLQWHKDLLMIQYNPSLGFQLPTSAFPLYSFCWSDNLGWDGTAAFPSKAQLGATSCQCGTRKETVGCTNGQNEKPRDTSRSSTSYQYVPHLWKLCGTCLLLMVHTQWDRRGACRDGQQPWKPLCYSSEMEKCRSTEAWGQKKWVSSAGSTSRYFCSCACVMWAAYGLVSHLWNGD